MAAGTSRRSDAELRPPAESGAVGALGKNHEEPERRDSRDATRDYRDRVLVNLVRLLRRGLGRLSLEASLALADRIAAVLPRVLVRENRISLEQLRETLPELDEAARVRTVRAMFRGIARSAIEVARLRELAPRLGSYVAMDGLESMEEALARGRGVIVVTGHIGNWELSAAAFGMRGYPVTVVAAPVKGARLNAESIATRTAVNVETIERDDPRAGGAILRTLKRGRILALVIDQALRSRSVMVPFFGRPASTPAGPAVLALRTGATILATFIHREEAGGHRLTVLPPALPPEPTAGAAEAWIEQTMATLNAMIEAEVRRRPDEWVWWHRRWVLPQ